MSSREKNDPAEVPDDVNTIKDRDDAEWLRLAGGRWVCVDSIDDTVLIEDLPALLALYGPVTW